MIETSRLFALCIAFAAAAPVSAEQTYRRLREESSILRAADTPGVPEIGRLRDVSPRIELKGLPVAKQPGPQGGLLQQLSNELSALYRQVSPSVVKIVMIGDDAVLKAIAMADAERQIDEGLAQKRLMQEFQKWLQTRGKPDLVADSFGFGTGFVIDPRGLILTNDHVVHNVTLGAAVMIEFVDGTKVPGKVLKMSPDDDVALVQAIVDHPLPALPLADSDRAQIGQVACALGNPRGFDSVFTCGTVTALNPELGIQHDAPITNGNSGGPLLTASGEVLGINYMVIKSEEGAVEPGMGFAIPINKVKKKFVR